MAEQRKTQRAQKKIFFEVKAPLTASKIYLYGASAEELNGRAVKLDLTRSLRGKSLELGLKIKLVDGSLVAEPVGVELVGSYIRRMMRKGADYVEDSFKAECRDAEVVIKPFMITRNKVSRAIRKELRNQARKFLEGYIKNRSTNEVFGEIMANKIQKELSLKLKKVYPLALCEIRIFEITKVKDKTSKEEEKKEEVVVEKVSEEK